MVASSLDVLAIYRALAPRLHAIAYRMLGSASDADDILQEAFVRWQAAPAHDEIRAPGAFLVTVVTRLCIDERRAARSRRETYVGTWLPEPVVEPADVAAPLSLAFLLLLQSLSPVERAVYVLHEAFDFEYGEIAPIVGKTEENCRQIARRATAALAAETARFSPSRDEQHRLAAAFAEATRAGDIGALAALFAEEIELRSDGGAGRRRFGSTRVANKPVLGKRAVTRFFAAVLAGAPARSEGRVATINGEPGLLGIIDGEVVSAITFRVENGLISAVFIVAAPEKLTRLSRGEGSVSSPRA